jgi:hypothetical protein
MAKDKLVKDYKETIECAEEMRTLAFTRGENEEVDQRLAEIGGRLNKVGISGKDIIQSADRKLYVIGDRISIRDTHTAFVNNQYNLYMGSPDASELSEYSKWRLSRPQIDDTDNTPVGDVIDITEQNHPKSE